MLTASDIINKYILFYTDNVRNHKQIQGASLVPQNDPTTLFTSSGMQPLVPYLLGEVHPDGTRLVDVQNCFRAQDIEEIGDNRHTTFFRMLGNWSLGDYFKQDQLMWLFEFLTDKEKGLGLNPHRLHVTIFAGDEKNNIPADIESKKLWEVLFAQHNIDVSERMHMYIYENWWSRAGSPDKMPVGEIGGTDSEVFYDFGAELQLHENSEWKNEQCNPNCDCGRFMEIGNSVFMEYIKQSDGSFSHLPKKNVDFGGGLERLLAAVENQQDMFQTNLFAPIILSVENVTHAKYSDHLAAMRIIVDHLISAVFITADGVHPSNKEQGYILRRLIRRAYDNINTIRGIEELNNPTNDIIHTIVSQYAQTDPLLTDRFIAIKETILEEANKYRTTLSNAKTFIEKKYKDQSLHDGEAKEISAEDAFVLYTTHGLSPTQIKSLGYHFNDQEFAEKMEAHQTLSRKGAEQKFKGGLADHEEKTIMGHTATHLLHQALRDVLGDQVHQTGSNITTERVRFDFNYDKKLTDEEIKRVEHIVNQKIQENLPVHFEILPLEEAKKLGAIGLFMDTYGDKVKIYFIGQYSIEFCGGPHVDFTGQLKSFTIIKQENLGASQKRLYAKVG